MAYFLGRDVKVAITTEHDADEDAGTGANSDHGIKIDASLTGNLDATDAAAEMAVPNREVATLFTNSDLMKTNPVVDVISVDVTVGAVDEDIAYMGQRTALKAEIKKENTVVITKKKDSKLFDEMFNKARYGLMEAEDGGTTPDVIGQTNLRQPSVIMGYRLHVQLKSAVEVISLPNMTLTEHAVTLNADGVQEESLTFMGHVTPIIAATATTSATSAVNL